MFVLAFMLQADAWEMGWRQEGVTAVQGAWDSWGQGKKVTEFVRRKSALPVLSFLRKTSGSADLGGQEYAY